MIENLLNRFQDLYPALVEIRRDLHMYPELSFQEEDTPKKIADFLTNLGLEVKTGVGGRGVLGKLKGGKPGKTVAFRADFDALPIQDEKEVAYKSRVPGVMHACGHDIHTAALLGVAKVLSEVKDKLEGEVVFIHQFAEEVIPGGAKPMIENGCLNGVDSIYGAHVASHLPFGTIGVNEGYLMASGDRFEIDILGVGGHGATPELTVDPLLVGSQLVMNLQQIVSRRVDPLKPAVVTVGSFNSGDAYNIIPNTAKIKGTVRTFDEDVRDLIEKSIGQIAKSTCEGAGATVKYSYERGYPAVWNHPNETRKVEELAKLLIGEEHVKKMKPHMGMEDFAYYLQRVPGTFFWVGGKNPDKNAIYPHHHPKFDVDEQSMLIIGKMFISIFLAKTTTIN
ncbi:amidohydrolase [Peribacillus frigoritolerans]|uniref:amidohydrolase n=1 Tax=Peribacillus frigoritolerans TaxID=450367 RepID=UPI002079C98A|nr:amidohydrolase [Peribacillus frigoritolerans]MCU6599397.1 amidohydrolase [Peribacillus frigoritolerans]USK82727.1 amidohydrolase [Peribacillus frigoritolerans]UZD49220.1 amidohydrolase [Peribacillus frigoritolerans]WJE49992.1 amidohydrolase [Peribacillus frigoritolerans]